MLLTLITYNRQLAEELATAESVTAKDPNHVDTFSLDFTFSFAEDIAKTSSLSRLKRLTPSTLLAGFIPTTKIRNPFLKTLENAAKSRILLACADRRIRQCYLTICAILADYKEQVLLTSIKKNRYCMRYTKHYNFNIHVSLATDTLHLLLKGLLIAIVSLLFVSKAPFALHFIRVVYDLVTLAQYKNIRMYRALDSICTRANSEAHYITIVKQFYSITNKKETALLAANYATVVKQSRPSTTLILGIQPYLTKLPLSEVAVNIAISNFIHAAAICISVQIHSSIKCWRSSSKRHNDPKYCNKELYLILIIINYTCYDKDRKYIAYIRAFSKVLLFNNNGQINNTTRMLSMRRQAWNAASKRWILQAFKFYDLSTIIRLVHLVLRDLPDLITRTTISYYVNNYIN
ncbi:hypothetical protein HBH69_108350 [Parastagonospora nodorum]|nr:hypothetical protein HBH69_108350 [Parastagonospora nodorum]